MHDFSFGDSVSDRVYPLKERRNDSSDNVRDIYITRETLLMLPKNSEAADLSWFRERKIPLRM